MDKTAKPVTFCAPLVPFHKVIAASWNRVRQDQEVESRLNLTLLPWFTL